MKTTKIAYYSICSKKEFAQPRFIKRPSSRAVPNDYDMQTFFGTLCITYCSNFSTALALLLGWDDNSVC